MDKTESNWIDKLNRNLVYLSERMHCDVDLFAHLVKAEVLRQRTSDEIQVNQAGYDRNIQLIAYMKAKSEKDYYHFLRALVETGQMHIAERIEGTDSLKEMLKLTDATTTLARSLDTNKSGSSSSIRPRKNSLWTMVEKLFKRESTTMTDEPELEAQGGTGPLFKDLVVSSDADEFVVPVKEFLSEDLNRLNQSQKYRLGSSSSIRPRKNSLWTMVKKLFKRENTTVTDEEEFKAQASTGSLSKTVDLFPGQTLEHADSGCIIPPEGALPDDVKRWNQCQEDPLGLLFDHVAIFGGTATTSDHIESLATKDPDTYQSPWTARLKTDPEYLLNEKYQSERSNGLSVCLHNDYVYLLQCSDDGALLHQHHCAGSGWETVQKIDVPGLSDCIIFSSSDGLYAYGMDPGFHAMILLRLDVRDRKSILVDFNNNAKKQFGVALSDNSFYITGGFIGKSCSAETERYDMDQRSWTHLPDMIQERASHGSVMVDDYIFVCGGKDEDSKALSSCEGYSVSKNIWVSIAPMKIKRYSFSVVASRGKLIAVGGKNDQSSHLASIEVYDPKFDRWIELSESLLEGRFGHEAIVLPVEYTETMLAYTLREAVETVPICRGSSDIGYK